MPKVMIWRPKKPRNQYGHAALQTDRYHISFWPNGDVKNDFGVLKTMVSGVEASLIYEHRLDKYYEDGLKPDCVYDIMNTTDDKINEHYEKFLEYNGIDPNLVNLAAGKIKMDRMEKLFKIFQLLNCHKDKVINLTESETEFNEMTEIYQEYLNCVGKFSDEAALDSKINEMHEFYREIMASNDIDCRLLSAIKLTDDQTELLPKPEIIIPKTRYSFIGFVLDNKKGVKIKTLFGFKRSDEKPTPYFEFNQSCTTFCYNLIEMADPHPQMSYDLPEPLLDDVKNFMDMTVPTFETIVKENYLGEKKSHSRSKFKKMNPATCINSPSYVARLLQVVEGVVCLCLPASIILLKPRHINI